MCVGDARSHTSTAALVALCEASHSSKPQQVPRKRTTNPHITTITITITITTIITTTTTAASAVTHPQHCLTGHTLFGRCTSPPLLSRPLALLSCHPAHSAAVLELYTSVSAWQGGGAAVKLRT